MGRNPNRIADTSPTIELGHSVPYQAFTKLWDRGHTLTASLLISLILGNKTCLAWLVSTGFLPTACSRSCSSSGYGRVGDWPVHTGFHQPKLKLPARTLSVIAIGQIINGRALTKYIVWGHYYLPFFRKLGNKQHMCNGVLGYLYWFN